MNRYRLLKCVVALSWMFFTQSAFATLDLELTQGMNAAVPVAMLPFRGGKVLSVPGNARLSRIVANDLRHSGEFRLMGMSPDEKTSPTDGQYWRKQGANYLLTGEVKKHLGNRYQVKVKLVSLFDPKKPIVFQESVTVYQQDARTVAHRISDEIYRKVVGVPGYFSSKIAYVLLQAKSPKHRLFKLVVSDADGFDPQPIAVSHQPIVSPAWSPNGRQIAYVSFEQHRSSIYFQDIKTGKRHLVSHFPGMNSAPAFSPDGKRLALVLTLTGNPKLYVLNIKMGQLTQVTKGYSIDTEPSWSSDGRYIAFTSSRSGGPQIYRYDLKAHKVERVSYDGNYNARPSYLPGTSDMVVMHRGWSGFGIGYLEAETGRVRDLTQGSQDESPSVAPNGKMVLYATYQGGRGVLSMVSTDGRIKLRLPSREGDVREPVWSPINGD